MLAFLFYIYIYTHIYCVCLISFVLKYHFVSVIKWCYFVFWVFSWFFVVLLAVFVVVLQGEGLSLKCIYFCDDASQQELN